MVNLSDLQMPPTPSSQDFEADSTPPFLRDARKKLNAEDVPFVASREKLSEGAFVRALRVVQDLPENTYATFGVSETETSEIIHGFLTPEIMTHLNILAPNLEILASDAEHGDFDARSEAFDAKPRDSNIRSGDSDANLKILTPI